MNSINDSEIQKPGFYILRCDRRFREGGGVCIYERNTKSFSVCLTYSNSMCDLLIVKFHQPSLISILIYRPPTCPTTEFNDIILKTKSYIMYLHSPLPNIIMLGDFNFPNIDWSCSTTSCHMAGPLIYLACLLFLTQQVKEPSRKHNILDLIFCSDDLVNYITTQSQFCLIIELLMLQLLYQFPRPYQWTKSFLKCLNRSDWPQLAKPSLNEIGPLMGPNKALTFDKYEICCSLLYQFNSVLQSHILKRLLLTLFFFPMQPSMSSTTDLYFTDNVLSDKITIDAIQELSPTSAAGPDGSLSSLLVNCATELAPFLPIIFTHSLSSGVVPPSYKRAAITPVFESGDRSVPSNFRPISLTSVMSKVLKRIIRKQVSSFIDKKGFQNSTQHGFRSGRCCLSALFNVFGDIIHMLDSGGSVDMVYLGFSKAVDRVDHGILLHKLKALEITGNLGMWYYNILTNRSNFVMLPGGISDDSPVLSVVPQCTVLGPLLFLIMVADIDKDVSESNLISFAGDTRSYTKIHDVSDYNLLQQDPNHIYDWASTNNMFNAHTFLLYYLKF